MRHAAAFNEHRHEQLAIDPADALYPDFSVVEAIPDFSVVEAVIDLGPRWALEKPLSKSQAADAKSNPRRASLVSYRPARLLART